MKGIGVFGGTFDPVHIGHLRTALEVADELALSEVRMIPSAQPPHRHAAESSRHRAQMLRLALEGQDRLRFDDHELLRSGPSYMVDTLGELRAQAPDRALVLILGVDAFAGLPSWKSWMELFELAHIAVMTRPGHPPDYPGVLMAEIARREVSEINELADHDCGRIAMVSVTQLPISSTGIRQLIHAGRDPRFLLPAAVLDYIRSQRLYFRSRMDHS
ncbi:MAG: putative nicotinate-nucleotide adenylyltransferase [Lysobacteraceae bacterium]|nr:MAG: putative nicotinate-nucleotide adenylyltransferase [Xanthomonadaceae bacterium]